MTVTPRTAYSDIPPEVRRHIEWTISTFEVIRRDERVISYQCVPADRGNWTGGAIGCSTLAGTNWGVACRTYAGWLSLPPDLMTEATMRAMPFETAVEIGYALFYRGPCLDRLGDATRPVLCLLDWGWGSGPFTAIREAQSVINALPDGRIGPRTVQAWNEFIAHEGEEALTNALVDARIAFSEADVARHPEQRRFLPIWRERYERFRPGRPLYD